MRAEWFGDATQKLVKPFAKIGQVLHSFVRRDMFHSNFSANFRCCERYHGCLATFNSLAFLPGGLSQGLRQFTRSARKQDLDRALVAAIVSKQV